MAPHQQQNMIGELSLLQTPVWAVRNFRREVVKLADENGSRAAMKSAGYSAYAMLLFLYDYDSGGVSEKDFMKLLKRKESGHFSSDDPQALSQSLLFDLFDDFGLSRESIRRLLLQLSSLGLIDRISKGPPFPDRLTISSRGRSLMKKVARRVEKDTRKHTPFGYL